MTEKTQPTDAELDMLIDEVAGLDSSDEVFREFARAVLAKWGTPPAVAGEPVAWEATVPGYIKYVTQSRYEKFSALAKGRYKPYKCSNCTTPQPIQPQAEAVPLTEAQRDAIWESCKYDDGEEWTVDWERIVDAVERHHGIGIKGGRQ